MHVWRYNLRIFAGYSSWSNYSLFHVYLVASSACERPEGFSALCYPHEWENGLGSIICAARMTGFAHFPLLAVIIFFVGTFEENNSSAASACSRFVLSELHNQTFQLNGGQLRSKCQILITLNVFLLKFTRFQSTLSDRMIVALWVWTRWLTLKRHLHQQWEQHCQLWPSARS